VYGREPEKLHEAGAYQEISWFPGGPVGHCMKMDHDDDEIQD